MILEKKISKGVYHNVFSKRVLNHNKLWRRGGILLFVFKIMEKIFYLLYNVSNVHQYDHMIESISKTLSTNNRVRVGARVHCNRVGLGPSILSSGRIGSGHEKSKPGRIRVLKSVPVQDSSSQYPRSNSPKIRPSTISEILLRGIFSK